MTLFRSGTQWVHFLGVNTKGVIKDENVFLYELLDSLAAKKFKMSDFEPAETENKKSKALFPAAVSEADEAFYNDLFVGVLTMSGLFYSSSLREVFKSYFFQSLTPFF